MVPMLKFYFHDDVRSAASESLPYLLESAKARGDEFVRQMWVFIVPELLKAIETDTVAECVSEHMEAFAEVWFFGVVDRLLGPDTVGGMDCR